MDLCHTDLRLSSCPVDVHKLCTKVWVGFYWKTPIWGIKLKLACEPDQKLKSLIPCTTLPFTLIGMYQRKSQNVSQVKWVLLSVHFPASGFIVSASLCEPPWSRHVSHLFLCAGQRRWNFPETGGEWRSPRLILTTLLLHMSLSPGGSPTPSQTPRAINPQNHIISWVHAFSAWLGPVGIKPQKPWQFQDCSGHSAYDNQQDMKFGLYRLWKGIYEMLIWTHVEKHIET